MLSRRTFLTGTGFALRRLQRESVFARLERANGGRLGVAVIDTATGEHIGFRVSERFPMCSTFKFLLVSSVLRRVDRNEEMLDRRIPIPAKRLLSNSPLTEPNAGAMMTVTELCHAAITRSDNTAANLLLESIGGPAGITAFCRSIGDKVTRLDRWELALNEAWPGDPRDTTSPAAMAANLKTLLLGDDLSLSSRDQLKNWMASNVTGLDRLRAKLPQGWRAADKTGSNGEHTSNDIAVLWSPAGTALIVTAYITQCGGQESKRAAMLAEIGFAVTSAF